MRQSERLKQFSKLTETQKNMIDRAIKDMVLMNEQIESNKPDVCPVCGAVHPKLFKRGKQAGKQRWSCCECGHKFTFDSHTITSNMKIGKDVFLEICLDTLNMVPIKKTAARLDVSVRCVFNNRHKFLSLLEEILESEELIMSGTIEGDETYILESLKGTKPKNRKARHRGRPASRRGISREQICIVTTTDRNEHEIFRAVGSAKPTSSIIYETLANHIEKESIAYVDGATFYDILQNEGCCKVKHLESHETYNKVEHLNTVNSIHSGIQEKIQRYRGVATKYMNRYASLFVFMRRYADMDDNEKIRLLVKTIKWFKCHITRDSLKTGHLFQGYADIPLAMS